MRPNHVQFGGRNAAFAVCWYGSGLVWSFIPVTTVARVGNIRSVVRVVWSVTCIVRQVCKCADVTCRGVFLAATECVGAIGAAIGQNNFQRYLQVRTARKIQGGYTGCVMAVCFVWLKRILFCFVDTNLHLTILGDVVLSVCVRSACFFFLMLRPCFDLLLAIVPGFSAADDARDELGLF